MIKFQEMDNVERLLSCLTFAISKIPYWVVLAIFILRDNITFSATVTTIITIFIAKLYIESMITGQSVLKNISTSIASSLITILKSMVFILLIYIYLFFSTDIERAILLTIAIIYVCYFYNAPTLQHSMYISIISSILWLLLIFSSDQVIWKLVLIFAICLLEGYHFVYNRLHNNLS